MTKIQWTDETWNPVVGCTRVSPGCDNCYAIGVAHRAMQPAHKGLTRLRPKSASRPGPDWSGVVRCVPDRLGTPLRWRKPRRVFVNSMSDLFHEQVPFEYIAAVYGVMAAAAWHTFQVLTKRPQRALEFFDWYEGESGAGASPLAALYSARDHVGSRNINRALEDCLERDAWPPRNVWLGVSAENQATWDKRVPLLLKCPAAVRWVSAEPLLGSLAGADRLGELDWLVIGGESGPGARALHIEWARELLRSCEARRVRAFVKQLGRYPGLALEDSKGGNPDEWPEDIRVRQWPRPA